MRRHGCHIGTALVYHTGTTLVPPWSWAGTTPVLSRCLTGLALRWRCVGAALVTGTTLALHEYGAGAALLLGWYCTVLVLSGHHTATVQVLKWDQRKGSAAPVKYEYTAVHCGDSASAVPAQHPQSDPGSITKSITDQLEIDSASIRGSSLGTLPGLAPLLPTFQAGRPTADRARHGGDPGLDSSPSVNHPGPICVPMRGRAGVHPGRRVPPGSGLGLGRSGGDLQLISGRPQQPLGGSDALA